VTVALEQNVSVSAVRTMPSSEQLVAELCKRFPWLFAEQAEKIARLLKVERIKGHTSLRGEWLYFLLRGAVKMGRRSTAARPAATLTIFAPGDIFGPFIRFPGNRNFTLETVGECLIAKAYPAVFNELLGGLSFPALQEFVKSLCRGQYALMARYAGFLRERVPRRIADTLLELADSFGIADARGIVLDIPITREDIAGLAGCSRELVTRSLIDFERRGLILRENRRLILDTAGLKKVGARYSMRPQPS
jgi:CRP/FNR family transcriptional regulator, nitrogen oxide reductase regulator